MPLKKSSLIEQDLDREINRNKHQQNESIYIKTLRLTVFIIFSTLYVYNGSFKSRIFGFTRQTICAKNWL